MRQAELKPDIPQIFFPAVCKDAEDAEDAEDGRSTQSKPAMNISRRRSNDAQKTVKQGRRDSDEIYDDVFDDGDFIAAGKPLDEILCRRISDSFPIAEALDCLPADEPKSLIVDSSGQQTKFAKRKMVTSKEIGGNTPEPAVQLGNGRWACNHRCKDKTAYIPIPEL